MAEQEQHGAVPHESAHPSPAKYILIATYLTLITIFEVLIYYVDALQDYFLWIFLVLSAVKFYYVAMFYMHLKFDAGIFKVLFTFGLVLATFLMILLLLLFSIII
ncbi:MAG: cytochrome C oxidase subunit IV family protein [Chloroflexi bacterium]|nr:cytochrome C oxidase subunit IV family protein [Chloroflexota bacterium]